MAWKMYHWKEERPVIAAHRGFSALYPENTLIAFEEAARLGVDMIELDVQISKDGIPVLYHDASLMEKTGHPRSVMDYTCQKLTEIQIGENLGFQPENIITLEDLLILYQNWPDILLNIDLKSAPVEVIVAPVLAMVNKHGYENRCIFNSLNGDVTKHLKAYTDFFTVGPPNNFPGNVNHVNGVDGTYATLDGVCVPTMTLTHEIADYYRSINKVLLCAPVEDEEKAKLSLDCGVQIIMCDDPRFLISQR
ncbi:MAG: glycerophosphodiester phosphodiesterase [Christensenellales bacterium]|jgi:glycerophosphoryl diester phosphodiesterase